MKTKPPTQSGPVVIRVAEAAEHLTVTHATVRKLIRTGQLHGCRIGGALRIRRDSVERLLGGALA